MHATRRADPPPVLPQEEADPPLLLPKEAAEGRLAAGAASVRR